ncbi:hypothetical protein BK010_02655 [Tenericutes bacterium MO-XQ]|nr:hypothetical protein BK010_02655 [Tenericutes bacterium MO-XQ]
MIWVTLIIWNLNIVLIEISIRLFKFQAKYLYLLYAALLVIISEIYVYSYINEFFWESIAMLFLGYAAVLKKGNNAPRLFQKNTLIKILLIIVIEITVYLIVKYMF